jgi:hypothetical protein
MGEDNKFWFNQSFQNTAIKQQEKLGGVSWVQDQVNETSIKAMNRVSRNPYIWYSLDEFETQRNFLIDNQNLEANDRQYKLTLLDQALKLQKEQK